MTDPRFVYVLFGVVLLFGLLIIGLLLRGGSTGAGGSSVSLSGLMEWFQGKKTYLVGTALLIIDQLHDLGWVTDAAAWKTEKTLLALAAFTIAAAQNRVARATSVATEAATEAATLAADTHQVVKAIAKPPVAPVKPPG